MPSTSKAVLNRILKQQTLEPSEYSNTITKPFSKQERVQASRAALAVFKNCFKEINNPSSIKKTKFLVDTTSYKIVPNRKYKEIIDNQTKSHTSGLFDATLNRLIYKKLKKDTPDSEGTLSRLFISEGERTVSSELSTNTFDDYVAFSSVGEYLTQSEMASSGATEQTFSVTSCSTNGGGGGRSVEIPAFLKKRGIHLVKNDDNICGQRCLALAECAKHDDIKNLLKPVREALWVKRAEAIAEKLEIPGRMTFADFDKWADLHQKRVVIIAMNFQAVYTTEHFYSESIYIFYDQVQEHYHYISDINAATNDLERQHKWCTTCNHSFLTRSFQTHKCIDTVCHLCKVDCLTTEAKASHFKSSSWPMCELCNVKCPGSACHQKHIDICKGYSIKCNACSKRCKKDHFPKHVCGEIWCQACESFHFDKNHRCCIKQLAKTQNEWKQDIYAYDFESEFLENNVHRVNLVVVEKLFCDDGPIMFDTIDQFVAFALEKTNATFIAHNAKSYDGWLVHKHLIKNTNKRPNTLILAGNKIMYMKVRSLRFIDSINHVAQALHTFPETFGLTELKKGFFPYTFNTPENRKYVGEIPDMKYFAPDQMKEETRKEFIKFWLNCKMSKMEYCFEKELREYCISDVKILKQAMEIYINAAVACDGLNPLKSSTIASDCMKVYRTNYMPKDKIAILTKEEYNFCKRGFFGGRTEVFKLHSKWDTAQVINGTYGKYVDINSLYPTVQYFDELPSGIPRWDSAYLSESDDIKAYLNNHFGYVEVDVTCPKDLIIPVLAEKKDQKLIFDLAPKVKQVYSSIELLKAIEVGYKVTRVYRALYFDRDADMFKSYVSNFLKLKVESSGYKGNDIDAYIQAYKDHCNVVLDKYNIKPNKGMKLLAKIRLNSLWGKFGQRDDMRSNEYLCPDKWFRLLNRHIKGEVVIHNETLIDENCLYAQYTEKNSDNSSLLTTNVAVAGFVTAQARLRLYKELHKLGDRVLYCDTDSIIYEYREGEYNVTEGNLLGQWEAETETPIIEFAALGPKSYAYKCMDPNEYDTKCKGVTLNYSNSQKFNFDTLKDLVFGEVDSITTHNMEFVKDKKLGQIRTVYDVAKVITFDKSRFKRTINPDFTTSAKE